LLGDRHHSERSPVIPKNHAMVQSNDGYSWSSPKNSRIDERRSFRIDCTTVRNRPDLRRIGGFSSVENRTDTMVIGGPLAGRRQLPRIRVGASRRVRRVSMRRGRSVGVGGDEHPSAASPSNRRLPGLHVPIASVWLQTNPGDPVYCRGAQLRIDLRDLAGASGPVRSTRPQRVAGRGIVSAPSRGLCTTCGGSSPSHVRRRGARRGAAALPGGTAGRRRPSPISTDFDHVKGDSAGQKWI
jgi:hypothetical protein